ncbi:MAG: YcgL domain-containing protein [Succinivibrionaceae bacterium]|nr:YcgL domain-containing protein [Succinivibrionaceae bacterium]
MAERMVYVYKSGRKAGRYLYIAEKDVFSHIPSGLLDAFGAPQFVMVFALSGRRSLPRVDPAALEAALSSKGYYLRIDTTDVVEENLLNEERRRQGLPPLSEESIHSFFH